MWLYPVSLNFLSHFYIKIFSYGHIQEYTNVSFIAGILFSEMATKNDHHIANLLSHFILLLNIKCFDKLMFYFLIVPLL